MLGDCGNSEDAPLLLHIVRENEWLETKMLAAKALAKIGDEHTLKELIQITDQLKKDEPGRRLKQQQGMHALVREINGKPNAVLNLPPPKVNYLDEIDKEITKLRIKVQEGQHAAKFDKLSAPLSPGSKLPRQSMPPTKTFSHFMGNHGGFILSLLGTVALIGGLIVWTLHRMRKH